MNELAAREVSIVTDVAGTTRDLVQVSIRLNGFQVCLTDTAGLRESNDKVERIGI